LKLQEEGGLEEEEGYRTLDGVKNWHSSRNC